MGSNNYGSFKTAIYIGPYENISNPESINFSNATTQGTKTITTHNQFIHMTTCGHTAYSKNFTTTDIENDHISIYQGTYNLYSAGCINSFGSVTCTATAGVTSSNVGTFVITNYTLVE